MKLLLYIDICIIVQPDDGFGKNAEIFCKNNKILENKSVSN